MPKISSLEDSTQKNMLGQPLQNCSTSPMTGYFRTGCCETDETDGGSHTVCTRVTAEFLEYSKKQGNDLSSQRPGFPGLKPGDQWCVCAARWKEAYDAGCAPKVVLAATHELATEIVPRAALLEHAIDGTQSLN
jgi:uncharacterized protein